MTKFKRKRVIDILGVKHKIRHIDTGENGGYYLTDEKALEVDKTINDKEKYLDVVLHEGFHGVLYLNGVHQDITIAQEHCIIDSIITFLKTNFDIEFKK